MFYDGIAEQSTSSLLINDQMSAGQVLGICGWDDDDENCPSNSKSRKLDQFEPRRTSADLRLIEMVVQTNHDVLKIDRCRELGSQA